MNGAESVVRTLLAYGVDTWFANPGTSEMHLVQAIDAVPEARPVLCLFEGVCTGGCGWIRPHERYAGDYALALGRRPRQRHRQLAQLPARGDAAHQHRRRPRHPPRTLRRTAHLGCGSGGQARFRLDPHIAHQRRRRPRRRRCGASGDVGPSGSAWRHRDTGVASGLRVGRWPCRRQSRGIRLGHHQAPRAGRCDRGRGAADRCGHRVVRRWYPA